MLETGGAHLKKVLALVLAFACAFTMFAGAASFTDQADISQTEAVDMLTALGVIQGYEDGTFRPDNTITRAEAAKMIYTIWNGGNDDASAFVGASNFTDVYSGHWAEGYINFCYANGIIAGIGNNRFAPEDNVTGTELAKMLLICMGYQADKSNLTGTSWVQNTNALATQNGLYVDVTSSVSAAMPRQFAAQLMYNALKADTVVWSSDRNAYERVSTVTYQMVSNNNGGYNLVPVTDYETLGQKCMGLETREIQLTSVKQENGRTTYSLNDGAFTRVATDYSDLIGQNVNVLIKDGETDQVYGVYADEDSSVVASGVVGQLETDDSNTVKLDGTSYDLDDDDTDVNVYVTNDDTASLTLNGLADMKDKTKAAWNIKLIDNDGDGDVNLAVVQEVTVAEVTYVNSDGIRVRGVNNNDSIDFDENDIYEDVARDDWAVVIDKDCTSSGDYIITKADVISGRVGSIHQNSSNETTEVRVDGTWYKNASSTLNTGIGAEVDLVVYGGVYFSVDGSVASLDVAVITGVGNWDNMDGVLPVRLMFKDGSEETVDVTAVGSNEIVNDSTANSGEITVASVRAMVDDMVAYDVDDNEYTLYTLTGGNPIMIGSRDTQHTAVTPTGSWSYDDDRAVIVSGSNSYDIADGAMIVIKNGDGDYIYMTGAELLDRNRITFDGSAQGYLALNEDGEVVALFGNTNSSTISSGATNYGYIVDAYEAENADQDTKLYIDVITADGLQEEVETDKSSIGSYTVGTIISYTMDGDVMVIDTVNSNIHTDAIRSSSDRSVRFYDRTATDATGATYSITSDTVIIAVSGSTTVSGDDDATFVGNYLTNADAKEFQNAVYVLDGTDIEVIFVEIDYQKDFACTNTVEGADAD